MNWLFEVESWVMNRKDGNWYLIQQKRNLDGRKYYRLDDGSIVRENDLTNFKDALK